MSFEYTDLVRDVVDRTADDYQEYLGNLEPDEDAALMLFEHYCSNKVESLNGYVSTTRDNVDIVTAFYYDVCDEAAKRVDNVD